MDSRLFTSLKIRGIQLKNRIVVSPMCQYSSVDGMPNDWHFVHLGSRAVGGAGLVFSEATAVSPEGRISPDDSGIWNEKHVESNRKITSFIKSQKSIPGIQLAHAGRKASTYSPWKGSGEVKREDGGWLTIAPSAIPFAENYPFPKEMNKDDIKNVIQQFKSAALKAIEAGFELIELHFAHGYLVHEFLSSFSNQRNDSYGGNLENRCRFAIEIASAVRGVIPESMPLFVRISASDWKDGMWDIEHSIKLSKWLKDAGVDLIDCSSGGNINGVKIPLGPGYQVTFADKIKREAKILTAAVGMITDPKQAEDILTKGQADLIVLGKELLRNPFWPLHAAKELNADIDWPNQYLRAKI